MELLFFEVGTRYTYQSKLILGDVDCLVVRPLHDIQNLFLEGNISAVPCPCYHIHFGFVILEEYLWRLP